MRIFYHAALNGIFTEALHGPKLLPVDQTEEERAAEKSREWIDNPDCEIPADAVEISAEQFETLLAGLGDGRSIVPGPDGMPALTPPKIFFVPETGGFANEDVHGQQRRAVWNSELDRLIGVPPVWEPNPDCLIPDGAIEISAERHAEMLQAQTEGQAIFAGPHGQPIAIERVQDEAERQLFRRRQRDRRLAASDWTSLPDTLVDQPDIKSAWSAYRQQLRDLDMAGTDWPLAPGEAAD